MGWDMGGRGKKDGWSRALAGGSCLSQGRKPPRPRARGRLVGAFGGFPPRSFYVTCVPWVPSTCGWEFWVSLGRLVAVSVGAGTDSPEGRVG